MAVGLIATAALAVGCSSGSSNHRATQPPQPSGLLTPPVCRAADNVPLAFLQATPDKSGTLQVGTVCAGQLQLHAAVPQLGRLTQAAWTTSGVIAVESYNGARDHFVKLNGSGQRQPYLANLSGTLLGLTRDNADRLVFVRYDPATKLYTVLRADGSSAPHEIANTSAYFVFAPGIAADGTYAIPETLRTATGAFNGQLQIVSPDGRSRIVKLPHIPLPTDVTWLNSATLLIRADTSPTKAGDYVFSLTSGTATPLAGGWLTLCATPTTVVLGRVGGAVGLLPKANPRGDAVVVVGKLKQLALACAPIGS